jgi:hypothetical protein
MCADWRMAGCRYASTLTFRFGFISYVLFTPIPSRNQHHNVSASPSNLIRYRSPSYARELFSNLSSIELKAIPAEHIIENA